MGQRLVVDLVVDKNIIANVYFHWSAYTHAAFLCMEELVEAYQNKAKEQPTLSKAEQILLSVNDFCGFTENSIAELKEKYPTIDWKKADNRNAGLGGYSEEDKQSSWDWSEGDGVINFDEETISNFCTFAIEDEEELKTFLEDNELTLDDLEKYPIQTVDIPWSEMNENAQIHTEPYYIYKTEVEDEYVMEISG